jgi:hypothetical protein
LSFGLRDSVSGVVYSFLEVRAWNGEDIGGFLRRIGLSTGNCVSSSTQAQIQK